MSDQRHHYAKDQLWNADQSLVKIGSEIRDARTFQLLRSVSAPRQGNWSNTNPNWWYGSTESGKQFVRVDMTTGAQTVLRTWSQYNTIEMGFDEGNISNDDKMALLIARTGGGIHLITYDTSTNTVIADKDFGGADLDWAGMSPSGNYVIADWNTNGSGQTQGVMVYDKNLNFVRNLFDVRQHGDVARDLAGNDVYVQYDNGGKVISWRLDTGQATTALNQSAWGHISGRCNHKLPGWWLGDDVDGGLPAQARRQPDHPPIRSPSLQLLCVRGAATGGSESGRRIAGAVGQRLGAARHPDPGLLGEDALAVSAKPFGNNGLATPMG